MQDATERRRRKYIFHEPSGNTLLTSRRDKRLGRKRADGIIMNMLRYFYGHDRRILYSPAPARWVAARQPRHTERTTVLISDWGFSYLARSGFAPQHYGGGPFDERGKTQPVHILHA